MWRVPLVGQLSGRWRIGAGRPDRRPPEISGRPLHGRGGRWGRACSASTADVVIRSSLELPAGYAAVAGLGVAAGLVVVRVVTPWLKRLGAATMASVV